MDYLRPWLGLGLGLLILLSGLRMALRPATFIGTGPIPASEPNTVRAFGIFFIVLGLVHLGLNLSYFASE